MIDYLVRIDDSTNATVTKWDGGYILQEYRVTKRKSWRCNCPVGRYRGGCKHTQMVRKEIDLQSR